MKLVRVAALLVVMMVLAACSGSGGAESSAGDAAGEGDVGAVGGQRVTAAEGEQEVALSGEGAGQAPADDAGDGKIATPDLEPLPPGTFDRQRIIKEGTISLEVKTGQFDNAYRAVIAAARRLGGDVAGSTTSVTDDGDTYGSVTVRVPVEEFENLLVGLQGVGEARNREIGSQDVSAEFTDLEARLRHLKSLERFYLGLFDDARSVQDAITVQQQLDQVQMQIEKAQGRLNLLDDRTSYSTLTVEIFEPGAGSVSIDEDEPSARPSLARYWDTARDAFVNVVGGMLVVLLFALPLLLPLGLLGAAWVAVRRRHYADHRDAEPPAEAEAERETVGAGR